MGRNLISIRGTCLKFVAALHRLLSLNPIAPAVKPSCLPMPLPHLKPGYNKSPLYTQPLPPWGQIGMSLAGLEGMTAAWRQELGLGSRG